LTAIRDAGYELAVLVQTQRRVMPFRAECELAVANKQGQPQTKKMTGIVHERAAQTSRIKVIDLQLVVEIQSRKLREPQPQVAACELVRDLQVFVLRCECVDDGE